jgi:intracellular sulfur oxidation DsrE/DsrF family protein
MPEKPRRHGKAMTLRYTDEERAMLTAIANLRHVTPTTAIRVLIAAEAERLLLAARSPAIEEAV